MAMTRLDLVRAIEERLGDLKSIYRDASTESDLYEAALLAIATEAASSAGGDCLVTEDGERPSSGLIFRKSPGDLWGGTYTHVVAAFGRTRKLEIHLGIRVAGRSGVAHECDVAILTQFAANRARRHRIRPTNRSLIASIEAKHYVATPGIGIGRAFLGLTAELAPPKCVLAFPAPESPKLSRLLDLHQTRCIGGIVPDEPAANELLRYLEERIRVRMDRT